MTPLIVGAILAALILFDEWRKRRKPATQFRIYVNNKDIPMAEKITTIQKITARLVPIDSTGAQAPYNGGKPTWTFDKPGIVQLFPLSDGLSCVITGLAVGTVIITAKDDVTGINGVGTVEVGPDLTPRPATAFRMEFDAPVNQ